MSTTVRFIQDTSEQLQNKITTSVKKRLKRKNKHFKKDQEIAKIIKVILHLYHLSQLLEPNLLHNYHQEISGFLYFAKNTFMKWLI